METLQSQIEANDKLLVPAVVKTRQSGGLRVNLWAIAGKDFMVEMENVGDPDDKEFNFQLDGQEMLMLQSIGLAALKLADNEKVNHIFDNPCSYREARERYARKNAKT